MDKLAFSLKVVKMIVFERFSKILQWVINLNYHPSAKDLQQRDTLLCYRILINWRELKIWWWKTGWLTQRNCPDKYTLLYSGTRHITAIEEASVTLHSVTEQDFVFVRCPKHVDLTDIVRYPFSFASQHDSAVELLRMSHETVFRYLMGRQSGAVFSGNGGNVVYLHSVGRCGGTLLSSIVHATGQCTVLAHPWPLYDLVFLLRDTNISPYRYVIILI